MKLIASGSVGRRHRLRRRAAAAAVSVAVVATGGAAFAADPAGSVTLASGLGTTGEYFYPMAHTSRGTVVSFPDSGRMAIVSDSGNEAPFPLAGDPYQVDGCADVVSSVTYPQDSAVIEWRNVVTDATGSRAVAAGREYVGATATGWLESEPVYGDTNTLKVHAITAGTGADAVLGTLAADAAGNPPWVSESVCSPTGVALSIYRDGGSDVVLLPTSGGQSVVASLQTPSGGVAGFTLYGLSGSTVAYRTTVADANGNQVTDATYRKQPGGAAETIPATTASPMWDVAISATDTLYVVMDAATGQPTYFRKPVGGSVARVSGIPVAPGLLAAAGGGFVAIGFGGADSGLYTVAGTSATRVWSPPLQPLTASALVVAPGRAVWSDDRRPANSAWARSLSGTTLTAGPESLLGTHVSAGVVVADGRRAAWTNDQSGKLVVHDGATAQTRADIGEVSAMSGHRVLGDVPTTTGAPRRMVTNLVTGTRTPAPSITSIWGNTGVGLDASGSIIKQDLPHGNQSVLLPAASTGVPSGGWLDSLTLEGDLLAWVTYGPGDAGVGSTSIHWRNLRTGVQSSKSINLANNFLGQLSIQGTVVAASRSDGSAPGMAVDTVYAIDTATGTVRPEISGAGPTNISAGPSGLGWVAASGEPKVSPLPDQHLRPRHEGNPFAPASFTATTGTTKPWVGEWVFTEPLTTCSVQVKNAAGTLVRTLPCNSTYAKLGEAVVSWEGKTTDGAVVPSGTYTWTMVGGDDDGTVLDVDGVSTSIKGNITVTGAVAADRYVALTPARIVDTRTGLGAPKAPVGAGKEIAVQVTGKGGVPTSGVSSVVLNVTAVAPTAGGFATVYPSGTTRPTASNINYGKGATIANQVIAKVGSDGKARLYTSAATNVIVDVAGYYPPGSRYTGLAPARILDTRSGVGAPKVRIPAGRTITLQVGGRGGAPATGADSVAINLTAVNPSSGGFLTAWPANATRPNASNVNYAPGQTIAGLAVVKLGAGGAISLYSSATTDLLVDLAGWFPTSSDFHGTTPARILDTRVGTGAPRAPIAAGGTYTLQVAGKGGVPATGVKAVLVNVTVVGPAAPGFLTAYPSTVPRPTASNLNYGKGQNIANTVVAKLGTDGKIKLYTSAGTHLITDIQGYITS